MAADIEIKKINQYVQELVAVTSITGAYVYGVDSNGNSIKIAVEVLASAGEDYSAEIAELQEACGNNATLIVQLQSALRGKANAVHTHQQSDITGLTAALEGKAAASHTHAQSDITGLTTALNGKANAVHSHQQSDISGLESALQGKAAAVHTHNQSDITGLTAALEGKADTDHTHEISDVEGLQNSLANINARIDEIDGGGVGNALRQEDLNTYIGAKSGDVIQNLGDDTAALQKYFIYECTEGSTVKTIPSGTRCLRLVQGSSVFISDQDVDASTTKFILYYRPTVDGVTYNFFGFATLGETERAKLVGTYVVTDGGETFQITDVTASGNNITAIVLDNGVTLPIDAQTPTRSTQALLTFYSQNGVEYYGTVGDCTLCSKDIVSNVAGTQAYLIATQPIGTLFGAQTEIFTASEDIVFKSVTWTQRNVQPPTSVASGDNFLTITNDELGASIDITYNSSNQHLELKGKNSAVVSYVDMSQFIVDGMLDDVQLYTTAEQGVTVEAPYLKFTFNVASGKSVIRVSLKDLVDIYDGANINLTSAFVKAAQYSAPAIGDSMNVAIGKLLKGHEDNASAISGKQDILTFDDAPQSGSNRPVTSQGIKAAIDSAIGNVPNALKQEDLTTYQGTNGEIVQHIGATTAEFVNGYVYKFKAGEIIIPANTLFIKAITGGRRFGSTDAEVAERIATYKLPFVHQGKKLIYESYANGMQVYFPDGEPKVGDPAVWGTGYVRHVTSVSAEKIIVDDSYEFPNSFAERDYYTDGNGVEIYTTFNAAYSFDGDFDSQQTYYELGTEWGAYQVTFTFSKSQSTTTFDEWQRINVQPSSEGAVSDLETRMTAAETAIQGKQPTITGAAATITTENLTASKILGSDANGKVAATSIATTDAEDAVSKKHEQNTDTKIQSGNNKVEVSASGTVITGNGSVTGNFSISGNLNVTGKETVEEIVNIKSENNFITLRDGAQTAIASGSLSGTKVENYDGLGNNLLFGTDASGVFRIGDEGGTLEPIATRDEASNLTDGQLMKWDATNQRMGGINDIRANTVNGAPLSNAASYFYGVSTSEANATQKEVSIPSITTLNAGQVIVVVPTVNSNTINNATLKLNEFVAYPIMQGDGGGDRLLNAAWKKDQASTFVFTGTKWLLVSVGFSPIYMSVSEGITGTSGSIRLVRADYLQQIIHGQIDKFVGTRAMPEDAYWDLVTAGTVQADTLYITFDNDWEG